MSYNEKYFTEHFTTSGIPYRVSIKKDNYIGPTRRLYLMGNNPCKVDQKHDGWFSPILGNSLSLSILNDATTNWYDLEDICTLDEKEFMITLDVSYNSGSVQQFDGFINSNIVTQKYANNSVINLTASNYVSKLTNIYPPSINTLGKQSLIDIINETLKLTGKEDNIRVLCTLEPSGTTLTETNSCFNLCGIDSEAFWKNNVDRNNGLEILTQILTTFDCYLYWWDGNWYIERYADMWTTDGSKHYVEYKSNNSYGFSDDASSIYLFEPSINLPISNFTNNNAFLGGSQSISMIPGLQFLEINTKLDEYINLTNPDLSRISGQSYAPEAMYPDIRGWWGYRTDSYTPPSTGWHFPGYRYGFLDGSSGFAFDWETIWLFYPTTYSYSTGPGAPYKTISNAIRRQGVPQYYSGGIYDHSDKHRASLSTRFKMTIENENTVLNLKWKFASPFPGSGGVQNWDHRCWYLLRVPPGNRFIRYDADKDFWVYGTSIADGSSNITVSGPDFDPNTAVAELSVTVPVGDVSGWTLGYGDFDIIFTLMGEDIKTVAESSFTPRLGQFPVWAYYGDFEFSANSGLQDSRITGVFNNKTLNKESVSLKIFDINNINYRNGIFYDNEYNTRTTLWTDKDNVNFYPLNKWLLHDRFQLYNKNRREITGDLKFTSPLKPFRMFYDTYDPSVRKYLNTDYTYNVAEDGYDCTFPEYDNTEQVNLNMI
jgi:hypothetical protein